MLPSSSGCGAMTFASKVLSSNISKGSTIWGSGLPNSGRAPAAVSVSSSTTWSPVPRKTQLTQGLGPNVLVTGHPYIDVWEAVRPKSVGIASWPKIPRGEDWKTGICRELGWGTPQEGWRRVYNSVESFRDLEAPLIGAVEQLVDFVTEPN